jgi:hypothetical protein
MEAVDPTPPPYTPPPPAALPQTQERDSDAASIQSLAPSYTSHTTELPSYESLQPLGLPRLRYAPGFSPATLVDPFSPSNFINSLSVQRSNPARRHYENIASRRVQRVEMWDSLIDSLSNLAALPDVPLARVAEETTETTTTNAEDAPRQGEAAVQNGVPQGAGIQTASSNRDMLLGYCPYVTPASSTWSAADSSASTTTNSNGPKLLPAHPHEDPELVGHAAAARARELREYHETILQEMSTQQTNQQQQEASVFNGVIGPLAGIRQQQRDWNRFSPNVLNGGRLNMRRKTAFWRRGRRRVC